MEQVESSDPGLAAPSVQLPVQLSLSWGDVSAEAGQFAAPRLPQEPREPLEPPLPASTGGADADRAQVMEAEARRAKMACVTLLGLLLFVLRYVDA